MTTKALTTETDRRPCNASRARGQAVRCAREAAEEAAGLALRDRSRSSSELGTARAERAQNDADVVSLRTRLLKLIGVPTPF